MTFAHSIDNVQCLLCHAVQTESFAGHPGRSWRCTRCGQRWDATRVEVVMDYQRWSKDGVTGAKEIDLQVLENIGAMAGAGMGGGMY